MKTPVRLPVAPRILLLGGGHAAGKTTALRQLHERHAHRTDWLWVHPDHDGGDLKEDTAKQYRALMRLWGRRDIVGIAMEGTRIYSTVFRCLVLSVYPRDLYLGLINQTADVMLAHLQARCEARGKKFNAAYWEGADNRRKADYEGQRRIPTAAHKLLLAHPELTPRVHIQAFSMDATYAAWPTIHTWMDQVVAG